MNIEKGCISWLWKTSRGLRVKSIANIIMGLMTVGLDFAFIWTTKRTIDIATGVLDSSLFWSSCVLVAIMATNIAMSFIRKWVSALLGVRSQNLMQLRTFSRLMRSVWTGMEQRHSGDVMNRLIRDAREITNVITDTLPQAFCVGVRLFGAFFFLYSMDSFLACIMMLIAPFFVMLSKLYIRKMRALNREIRNTDSRIQSILQESIQNRVVLKTLEQTEGMIGQLADTQDSLQRQVRHQTLFSSTSNLIVSVGFALGYLTTFLWGVHRLHDGSISYGMMLAFIQLVGQIQGPFRDMTRFVPIIINALTATERMMELENTPLEEEGNSILFPHGVGIRFHDVTFAYDKKYRYILQHFSHDFRPGSTTAILGETGSGKTTMIRLILALLQPDNGSVEFYDESTSVIVSPMTRCNIVYVPQGNTLLSGTIRDNLLMGNPDATSQELEEALLLACADFVINLPDGLDTLCGERGSGLSEGQAQRIAIARALLRQGNIMLLDEATSALDRETEYKLLDNISRRAQEKRQTILFITHRPAIVEYCQESLKLTRNETADN